MIVKNIMRDSTSRLYIANEQSMHTDAMYMDKICVTVKGSKDVYYLNMANGNMYVYRDKLRNQVNGCLFVRNRDEYTEIYDAIAYQQFAGMPENIFVALDRMYATE